MAGRGARDTSSRGAPLIAGQSACRPGVRTSDGGPRGTPRRARAIGGWGALGLGLVLVLAHPVGYAREPDLPEVPREDYRARRERLAVLLPDGRPAVLESGERPRGEHDQDFRVASDFFYLTGVDVHGAELILWRRPEGGFGEVLLLPRRTDSQARWESPFLHAGDPRARMLGFALVGQAGRSARERAVAPLGALLEPDEGRALVRRLRLVKDAHEVARIERAAAITGAALVEGMRSVEPGMDEQELDALIRYVFKREGAPRAAFPSIVGSGPNTCILHYATNRRVMREGDLVLCDVGAEVDRYAADVTRTFPVSGRFTARQRELYLAVLEAQEAGFAAVKPGATLGSVHRAARAVLERRGLARHFFHGTSHWLGLDVHDPCPSDTPFTPGMVLTVEPGVYLDDESIGIRIEDDVVVTEDGCRVLSLHAPRHPDAIEALMLERGLGNEPLRPYDPAARPSPAEPARPGIEGPF